MPSKKAEKAKKAKGYSMGRKSQTVELTLPSVDDDGDHNKCRVRVPDPQALIRLGILDRYDSLSRLVGLKIDELEQKGKAPKALKQASPEQVQALAANMGDILAGVELIDRIVEYMVIEPKVLRPVLRDEFNKPIVFEGKEVELPPSERDEDQMYTDEVALEDKLFILQFAVGGDQDLDAFRAGTAALMVPVADGEGLPLQTI